MKTRLFKLGMLLVPSLCLGLSLDAFAAGTPVSMLTQVQGDVQVSKDGKEWKKVDRNKFLFAGYQVKTGADGVGKLVNQTTNLTQEVAANSVVEITEADVKALSGKISAPAQDSGNLVDGIGQRFDKAQRYTTVRRSVEKKATEVKLDTVSEITLSAAYPDLVWSGMGKEYSYRLVIDGKNHDIAATDNEIIRFTVPALSAGEHDYRVDVMQGSNAVYEPKKSGKIKWLSKDEEKQIADGLAKIEKTSPGDTFFKAYFLDDKGLTVSALDLYRKYFESNADDVDMYPMLIKAYNDLKLEKQKKESALKLQDMRKAAGG
ncbi:MAG: hypothetical protein HQM04_01875 [Magnetococcales bacterium]|nr:hypothetical protein [Magnetococcales bacterium]MBF0113768.1 hypothetical protein [Magnetococcales bacterium]